ncbi:uncharacterized protein DEA37_0011788 [Paragonimus westermani]|uniref:Uncharacterized protein n=1 Tax=Paragonimus westermani TaxID=34504 RepID=A0A5J4NQR8_9TREM|nr:uncharacterized protein DEA37_0011788 [Paragonimus westermani]
MGNAVFALSVNGLGFTSFVAGFVSPYWLQSYSRIHTPFSRLGLWEFCMNGFILRTDANMKSYFGCWWIYSPEYDGIRDFLAPWWFIIIQVFMSVSLLLYCLSIVSLLFYVFCELSNSKIRCVISMLVLVLNLVIACLVTVSVIIFGINQLNEDWMPYPFLNWPSSGYGFAILSGCLSFITVGYIGVQVSVDKRVHEEDAFNFPLVTIPSANSHG